jgi:tRNA U34 5-methylaminomethyl-2-thiouridine-forming methyltransferase MnmC
MYQLVITADGSHTIYVPGLNEHYHSVHGAVQESELIFIKYGFEFCKADPVSIFEVGFGTGLNVLLTAIRTLSGSRVVNYVAIEKFPLPEQIINTINYHKFAGTGSKELFKKIHSSPWNVNVKICKNFNLKKIEGDMENHVIEGFYDLFYFDAFGPDKQPELWTRNIFEMISSASTRSSIIVTYSAKGEVKRNLKACNFDVSLLPGPPGKREIIRAIKI